MNGHSNTSAIPDLHAVRHGMVSPSPSLSINGQPLSPSSTLCSRRNYSSPLANNSSAGLRPSLVQSVSQSSIASDASVDSAISNLTAHGSEYSGASGGGDTASIISDGSKASIKTNDSSSGDSSISNGSDGYSFITAATSSLISVHRPLHSASATASVASSRSNSRSSSISGCSSIGSIYLGSRPLPLTPMQEMLLHQTSSRSSSVRRQRPLSEGHLAPLTVAAIAAEFNQENDIDRRDNDHGVERNSSVGGVSESTKTTKAAVGSMGMVYEGLKVLQEQVSLTETRNLKVLDRCADAAIESRMEDLMRWEAMAKQYEELVKQLASAKAYQAKVSDCTTDLH